MAVITELIVNFVLYLVSIVPLYLLVKLLGGKTSLLRTVFIVFFSGLILSSIDAYYQTMGGVLASLFLIVIYHYAFQLRWWKAALVWLVQEAFVKLFAAILLAVFGV